ncbi:MAG: fasciclin domain-containing protein [Thermoanaerobaculia bacterium]
MHTIRFRSLAVLLLIAAVPAFAAMGTVMVGGEAMLPSRDIVDNAVLSADHTTLVAAVQAAGLVDTLKGDGPFTVFAPTNDAFEDLPEGTVETLLEPENKDALTGVLTYHVVPGKLDMAALRQIATTGDGTLTTVAGGTLKVSMNGPANVVVTDAAGRTASISTYDVLQSNGVIHVIDGVLLPQ